jgi:hypothetical protein
MSRMGKRRLETMTAAKRTAPAYRVKGSAPGRSDHARVVKLRDASKK